jgi:hypothetical protein
MQQPTQQRRPRNDENKEVLIPDSRAQLTPAQMVERKLVALLQRTSMPYSCLQTRRHQGPR